MNIEIRIPGKPIAKARPKFFSKKTKSGKRFVGSYNAQATEEGKFIVQVMDQLPKGFKPFERDVGLMLSCFFAMPIPKSTSKKKKRLMTDGEIIHTKKPDGDNLVKFVKDCCNGIVWYDDSQVARHESWKFYSEHPSTEFHITKL